MPLLIQNRDHDRAHHLTPRAALAATRRRAKHLFAHAESSLLFYFRSIPAVCAGGESMRWRVTPFIVIALALPSCSDPAAQVTDRSRITSLEAQIAKRDREIGELKAEVAAMRQLRDEATAETARVTKAYQVPVVETKPTVAMCFKDYCPCDPPQGGPDTVLCDQLEEGVNVDVQMMIAGRGMREARRQMQTGDY